MDFVGTAWMGYMNEIHTVNADTGPEININQYMSKIKRLLKMKSNLHWPVDFLQQYV